jgi:glycosyltransferase involved in cell wall biosynthesis
MKVSLIIPTRNEAGCIGTVLAQIPRSIVDEIIVVDGHSTDGTWDEAYRNIRKSDQLLIQKKTGYGGALLEGIRKARGDVIVFMDADGSHNPKDITKMINKIRQGYDYVMASRYLKSGCSDDDTLVRYIGNRFFTTLTNWLYGMSVSDSLYLFTAVRRKKLIQLQLDATGFDFCSELIIRAHQGGLRFAEVAVVEKKRLYGKSKVHALRHGWDILVMIITCKFTASKRVT